jgi:DNA primase
MKPHSRLVSVHRLRIPCPICGHRDNCAVSDDGTYCRREPSPYQGRDGGWWHPNEDTADRPAPIFKPAPHVIEQPRADRQLIHAIYSALLRLLVLLPAHRDALLARGLSLQTIERELFRSTSTEEEAREIAENLVETCDPKGVPGFFRRSGRWQMVKAPSGFFTVVRDRAGLIQGLQIRKDYQKDKDDPRYIWLSSNPEFYPLGTKSGSLIHIQHGERITITGKAIITEGPLKSIVASEFLSPDEGGIVALPSVNTFRETLGSHLTEVWPNLQTVNISFDADWKSKREVKFHLHRLIQVLKGAGLSVNVRTWPTTEKGIDDYLLSKSYAVAEVA